MRGMMTEHGVRADDYLAMCIRSIIRAGAEPGDGAAIAKLPDAN